MHPSSSPSPPTPPHSRRSSPPMVASRYPNSRLNHQSRDPLTPQTSLTLSTADLRPNESPHSVASVDLNSTAAPSAYHHALEATLSRLALSADDDASESQQKRQAESHLPSDLFALGPIDTSTFPDLRKRPSLSLKPPSAPLLDSIARFSSATSPASSTDRSHQSSGKSVTSQRDAYEIAAELERVQVRESASGRRRGGITRTDESPIGLGMDFGAGVGVLPGRGDAGNRSHRSQATFARDEQVNQSSAPVFPFQHSTNESCLSFSPFSSTTTLPAPAREDLSQHRPDDRPVESAQQLTVSSDEPRKQVDRTGSHASRWAPRVPDQPIQSSVQHQSSIQQSSPTDSYLNDILSLIGQQTKANADHFEGIRSQSTSQSGQGAPQPVALLSAEELLTQFQAIQHLHPGVFGRHSSSPPSTISSGFSSNSDSNSPYSPYFGNNVQSLDVSSHLRSANPFQFSQSNAGNEAAENGLFAQLGMGSGSVGTRGSSGERLGLTQAQTIDLLRGIGGSINPVVVRESIYFFIQHRRGG